MSTVELLILIGLITSSGFLSASEVALFSLSRFQLRYLRDHFKIAHKRIRKLLSDPSGLLLTLLVTNEIVNISISTIIANSIGAAWNKEGDNLSSYIPISVLETIPSWAIQSFIGLIVTTPIFLFACEITPKVIGTRINQVIASLFARPLHLVYLITRPLRMIALGVTHFFLKKKKKSEQSKNNSPEDRPLQEEEFLLKVEEGHKEGMIHQSELDLIRNVFDMDDTRIRDIYTPLSQVFTLNDHIKIKDALTIQKRKNFSRIPVIGKNKKDIVGILYAKDLLFAKMNGEDLNSPILSIIRKPYFVSATMKLNTLFRRMKKNRIHIAMVTSPLDETIGLITMNDILDELFDDLLPEEDITPTRVILKAKGATLS